MVVDALVQRIDDNDARDVHLRERPHDEVLELRNEGGMGNGGILLDNLDDVASNVRIMAGELICEGWKYVFEEPPVKEISRTEKASTERAFVIEFF